MEAVLKAWGARNQGHREETSLMEGNGLTSFLLLMSCEYLYFIPLCYGQLYNANVPLLILRIKNKNKKLKMEEKRKTAKSFSLIISGFMSSVGQ